MGLSSESDEGQSKDKVTRRARWYKVYGAQRAAKGRQEVIWTDLGV